MHAVPRFRCTFGPLLIAHQHWSGWTAEEFVGALGGYVRWYREGRLKAFREGGLTVYDTIRGRRERLGLAA